MYPLNKSLLMLTSIYSVFNAYALMDRNIFKLRERKKKWKRKK